eukprot:NODE_1118_length_1571_cov_78.861367_g921_i0.p1 GENE.NODE_1118_length_1571_cov_78.861367_g921_i0~~NODE_1118_length_1571_cov_78.861367_g921_i0.p1  ORF type:complete len:464 (-),score=115.94 NODE_1118_length_1571_cov_78.861367_g921_i0:104-1495(-)
MEKYDMGEKLGSGSYAEVFLCKEKSTGQEFAMKMLDKKKAGAKGMKAAFAEVDILRSLNHPNVIGLRDAFETEKDLVMVLELVRGGELFDKIVALKHYSEDTAAQLARNLTQCIKYLNDQGVAHRDIKPENLMLRNKHVEGERLTEGLLTDIKLVDFGFAVRFDQRPFDECCGTPNFIAPEILQFGIFKTIPTGYTERCDMWSIGVLVYILLCGYPPFHDKSRTGMFKKIVAGKFWFHKGTVWEKISEEAKDFVQRLIRVEPGTRMTADEALQHPWLLSARNDEPLPEALNELQIFNAREKMKGAVYGIGAVTRLMFLNKCKALNAKPNTGLLDTLTEMNDHNCEVLDQSSNYLGKKGISALVEILPTLTSLSTLVLRDNQIDNEVVQILCQGIRSHPTLASVDLRGNPISLMGARALLNTLQANHRIRNLDLDTDDCKAYKSKIQEQLERNRLEGMGVTTPP